MNIKEFLQQLSKSNAWFDDDEFMPHEFSGGNFDDAYYGGVNDGKIELARELIERFYNEN